MLGLASSSSGLPSQQLSLYQAKLQQARREATQAEAKLKSLEKQTEAARQEFAQTHNEVRQVEHQTSQHNSATPIINSRGEATGRLLNVQA
ncbi:MAG: hypothetical protein Q8K91_12510 [Hylemonella sp.]|nr:hypothetical protein [Hylemonella sp.]MDP1938021.1 hypothetical protein [Hylemonella sp.]